MKEITLKAHGKINLALHVGARRADGYHELSSVMQSVGLCDEISVAKNLSSRVTVRSDSAAVPCGAENIAVRAAELMREKFSIADGLDIFIKKRIPIGGGMAGGSTDAAAVMHAFDALFGLGAGIDSLCALGSTIGADVPFCLHSGCALAEGIGERLTAVRPPAARSIVLINPNIFVSTGRIFGLMDNKPERRYSDCSALASALDGSNLKAACGCMTNDMQPFTAALHPVIYEITEKLKRAGALAAIMSGSGATCFGIFDREADTEKIRSEYPDFFIEETFPVKNRQCP